jgi:hypothetical protein
LVMRTGSGGQSVVVMACPPVRIGTRRYSTEY